MIIKISIYIIKHAGSITLCRINYIEIVSQKTYDFIEFISQEFILNGMKSIWSILRSIWPWELV